MVLRIVICPECRAEVATHIFAKLPLCSMCYAKIVAAWNRCAAKPFPKWDNSAAIVQAKDLHHGLEADL